MYCRWCSWNKHRAIIFLLAAFAKPIQNWPIRRLARFHRFHCVQEPRKLAQFVLIFDSISDADAHSGLIKTVWLDSGATFKDCHRTFAWNTVASDLWMSDILKPRSSLWIPTPHLETKLDSTFPFYQFLWLNNQICFSRDCAVEAEANYENDDAIHIEVLPPNGLTVTTSLDNARRHRRLGGSTCDICSESFRLKRELKRHMKKIHQSEIVNEKSSASWTCEVKE